MEMEKTTIYIGEVIKNVMVEKLVTKAELARRLQVKPQSVDYMLTHVTNAGEFPAGGASA